MKTIYSVTTTMAMLLCLVGAAEAAEYYVYRATDGKVVLTNATPPSSAKELVTYHLTDATAEEIAATEGGSGDGLSILANLLYRNPAHTKSLRSDSRLLLRLAVIDPRLF